MSDIQFKNGFTAIPDEIFEAIYTAKFTATELKTVLVVARFTYGFRRKFTPLSMSFLSAATGVTQRSIERAIASLTEKGVILSVPGGSRKDSKMLGINKNYTEWSTENVLKTCSNYVEEVLKTPSYVENLLKTCSKVQIDDENIAAENFPEKTTSDTAVGRTTDTAVATSDTAVGQERQLTTTILKHSPLYPPTGEKSENGAGRTLPNVKNFSGPCIDYRDYNNDTTVDLLSGLSFSREDWNELEQRVGVVKLAQYFDKLRDGYLNRGWKLKTDVMEIIERWIRKDEADAI